MVKSRIFHFCIKSVQLEEAKHMLLKTMTSKYIDNYLFYNNNNYPSTIHTLNISGRAGNTKPLSSQNHRYRQYT